MLYLASTSPWCNHLPKTLIFANTCCFPVGKLRFDQVSDLTNWGFAFTSLRLVHVMWSRLCLDNSKRPQKTDFRSESGFGQTMIFSASVIPSGTGTAACGWTVTKTLSQTREQFSDMLRSFWVGWVQGGIMRLIPWSSLSQFKNDLNFSHLQPWTV